MEKRKVERVNFNKQKDYRTYSIFYLKTIIIPLLLTVLTGVINFFTRRQTALGMEKIEYGFFYSCFSFFMFLLAILDLGLNQSSTILISKLNIENKNEESKKLFSTLSIIRFVQGLIVYAIVYYSSYYLNYYYFEFPGGENTLKLMGLWLSSMVIFRTLFSVFEGLKLFSYRNLIQLIYFSFVLIFIFLFANKLDPFWSGVSFLLGSIIAVIFSYFYLGIVLKFKIFPNFEEFKHYLCVLFRYSKWVSISTTGILVVFQMDTVMLTALTNLEQVAIYNVALPIMQIFLSLMLPISQIFTPIATENWHKGDKKTIFGHLYLISTFLVFSIFFCVIGIYFYGEWLITFLFKADFSNGKIVLLFLVASTPFFVLSQLVLNLLNIIQKQKVGGLIVVFAILINSILNLLLIPIYNFNGAGFASLVTYLFVFIISLFAFKMYAKN